MKTTKTSYNSTKKKSSSPERKRERSQSLSATEDKGILPPEPSTEDLLSPFAPPPTEEQNSPHFEKIASNIAEMETFELPSKPQLTPPSNVEGKYELNRRILAKIVTLAAEEIEGLMPPKKDWRTRLEDLLKGRIDGVRVDVGTTEAAVDVLTRVVYGADIPTLASKLKEKIASRIWEMTGLRVVEVNIAIQDIIPTTSNHS